MPSPEWKVDDQKWNLTNLPPKGHKDGPEFFAQLFDIAKKEKERLGKAGDFLHNYALYRGQDGSTNLFSKVVKKKLPNLVNLYFANVERTVSNITARKPTGEVVDMDGGEDDTERLLSVALEKWWQESNQQRITRASARTMEIYGITAEKPFWDKDGGQPGVAVTDPFAVFPAPGNWENISEDAPYVCFAYVDFIDSIEKGYEVKGVAEEDAYELLGAEREDFKPEGRYGTSKTLGHYEDTMMVRRQGENAGDNKIKRGLIIEIWVRDDSEKTITEEYPVLDEEGMLVFDPETGEPVIETIKKKVPAFRDGIRKVTITKKKAGDRTGKKEESKSAWMICEDSENPNLNPAMEDDLASVTYPWGRLPCYHANSYKDLITVWGFAAAEQVGDLMAEINTIIRKIVEYVKNVMTPPLIVQQHCGITRQMIESEISKGGRLILMPTNPQARIEFLQVPNLPSTFFNALELILDLFDRVYQIEDADRGRAPNGVIAAAAIQALQERNAVLMQSKTTSIDSLVENRSRWAIGLWQNFGTQTEFVNVNGESVPFIGAQFAGRKFNFAVESGSTMPRTQLQIQEMAVQLYDKQAIDRRALLEVLNFPGWQEIIERLGENQLEALINGMIQAGLPEEPPGDGSVYDVLNAQVLYEVISQSQGGPGDEGQPEKTTEMQAEDQRAKQREAPNAAI